MDFIIIGIAGFIERLIFVAELAGVLDIIESVFQRFKEANLLENITKTAHNIETKPRGLFGVGPDIGIRPVFYNVLVVFFEEFVRKLDVVPLHGWSQYIYII
jgi:hypothetical protein